MVVGTDGKTHDVRIVRSLGMGLDEKSVEAIRTWRFEPATKNGQTFALALPGHFGLSLDKAALVSYN